MPAQCECCYGAADTYLDIGNTTYYRCSSCGHVFLQGVFDRSYTASIYGDGYFHSGGAGYQSYDAESELQRVRGVRYGNILRRHTAPGRLLDVGCAGGSVLQGFSEAGWTSEGIEPNDSMARRARESNVPVYTGSLEDAIPELERRFDAVAMLQVVAHFRDARGAFQNASKYSRRGALLLVETWNVESLTARLLGRQWHELSPPSVLRIFTPRSLDTLAEQYGYRRIARGHMIKWISSAHAKSLLDYKRGSGALMNAAASLARVLPDRLAIPYPGDDLFWQLYRYNPNA